MVQEEVQAAVKEERASAVAMKQQEAWTKWEQAMEQKVTWEDIWKAECHRIKFLKKGIYDVLPSPSNCSAGAR